jgi:integrase/recombinase XerD
MAHIKVEKGLSANTIVAYNRDLLGFFEFLKTRGVTPLQVGQHDLLSFVAERRVQLAARSLARCLVSIRMFYRFCVTEGKITSNPARLLGIPKLYQHLPHILSRDEVEALLSQCIMLTWRQALSGQ